MDNKGFISKNRKTVDLNPTVDISKDSYSVTTTFGYTKEVRDSLKRMEKLLKARILKELYEELYEDFISTTPCSKRDCEDCPFYMESLRTCFEYDMIDVFDCFIKHYEKENNNEN